MFKKIIFLYLALMMIAFMATAQQKPFTINGTIKGKTGSHIYLTFPGDKPGKMNIDSSLIENGHFQFKGKLDGTAQAYVSIKKQPRSFEDYVQLFIVPAEMQLSLDTKDLSAAVLKGSPVQAEADELNKSKEPYMAKIKAMSKDYEEANMAYIKAKKANESDATLDSLKNIGEQKKDAMEPMQKEMGKIQTEFMDSHPASYVTASLLQFAINEMSLQEGETRYNKLPDDIKNTALGKELKGDLDALRMGSPGAKAHDFTTTELRGDSLSLSDYRGKYVLLDFWASWCVPCRAGNPHLLKLYSKYKNEGKGLEIIGVADDDNNPDAWKKAVEKDGIGVWKHVLRGLKTLPNYQFDRSKSIGDKYGINSLPTKILIDPIGMIIGRFGGGGENDEAMDKKLEEIFGS